MINKIKEFIFGKKEVDSTPKAKVLKILITPYAKTLTIEPGEWCEVDTGGMDLGVWHDQFKLDQFDESELEEAIKQLQQELVSRNLRSPRLIMLRVFMQQDNTMCDDICFTFPTTDIAPLGMLVEAKRQIDEEIEKRSTTTIVSKSEGIGAEDFVCDNCKARKNKDELNSVPPFNPSIKNLSLCNNCLDDFGGNMYSFSPSGSVEVNFTFGLADMKREGAPDPDYFNIAEAARVRYQRNLQIDKEIEKRSDVALRRVILDTKEGREIKNETGLPRREIAFLRDPWEDCKEICAPCMTDHEWTNYIGMLNRKTLWELLDRYKELKEEKNLHGGSPHETGVSDVQSRSPANSYAYQPHPLAKGNILRIPGDFEDLKPWLTTVSQENLDYLNKACNEIKAEVMKRAEAIIEQKRKENGEYPTSYINEDEFKPTRSSRRKINTRRHDRKMSKKQEVRNEK